MSVPIAPLTAATPLTPPSASEVRTRKLDQAAKDFESLLVKQLLRASHVGGEAKSGYADMAVDALADGIERSGGLGMAARIEQALGLGRKDAGG